MSQIIPTLWRVTVTMKADSGAGTLFDATINIPDILKGTEISYTVLQLNYPVIIEDGFIESPVTPDAQLVIVANDGQKVVYSNPLNHTVVQSGRPRIPMFSKPLFIRPMTKIQLKLRNLDTVGASDVSVTIYLKVRTV